MLTLRSIDFKLAVKADLEAVSLVTIRHSEIAVVCTCIDVPNVLLV